MRRRGQLSTRILASVVVILIASTLVGFALVTLYQRSTLERQYQNRALAIAQTFAAMPSIREAMARRSPADRRLIQSLAGQVTTKSLFGNLMRLASGCALARPGAGLVPGPVPGVGSGRCARP